MTGGAILTFAGVATSHFGIGFGGITAGTITGLSGASDIEQGINEIKLGLRNDRTTRTGNYVRDTLYDENETIYHLSTGVAAMAAGARGTLSGKLDGLTANERAIVEELLASAFDTLNMLLDDLGINNTLTDSQKWNLIN